MQRALAVAATLVSLAFAMSTFERWLRGHRRHELAWSVALGLFCIASGCLAAGAGLGWNSLSFRLFFFFGAIANVPVLALGTIYLLGGEPRGNQAAAAIALFCAFGAGVMAVAPLTGPIPHRELAQASTVFGQLPRVLAGVGSGGGALVVVGGAILSAVRRPNRRMIVANVLIALGTGITGASGVLNSALGAMEAFSITLVLGISVLFVGFLVATGTRRP